MKKIVSFIAITLAIVGFLASPVFASQEVLNNTKTTSELIQISEDQKEELQDYIDSYGTETYGWTAFILNKIRLYSIPFCFLGIVISAIYQYVIGIRKLDVRYKGFYTMIAFITLFVIAQILPLVFVIVIKGFGRS